MPKAELLNKILAARYDFDYAARPAKAECLENLNALLDQAIDGTTVSRFELLHSLHDRYIEFKRARRNHEKVSVSQRLRS